MVKARQDCPTRNYLRTSLAAALALLAWDASAANVGDPPRNLSAYPVIGQVSRAPNFGHVPAPQRFYVLA